MNAEPFTDISARLVPEIIQDVSSAYWKTGQIRCLKLFTHNIKRSGPNIEPWGTPIVICSNMMKMLIWNAKRL